MKKFFVAMMIALTLCSGNFAEAVPISRTQLDKIFYEVEQTPATNPPLNLDAETFKEKFNGYIVPILKDALGTDDISAVEYLFLIKDYKIIGKTFANMFGDYRMMIVASGENFTSLNFYYTTPEEKDESIFTAWLLTAFVKTVAPDVDAQKLMNDLTAENSSGSVVAGGIKFSIAAEGNLNVLTAVKS